MSRTMVRKYLLTIANIDMMEDIYLSMFEWALEHWLRYKHMKYIGINMWTGLNFLFLIHLVVFMPPPSAVSCRGVYWSHVFRHSVRPSQNLMRGYLLSFLFPINDLHHISHAFVWP